MILFLILTISLEARSQSDSIGNAIVLKHIDSVGGVERIESIKSELKKFNIKKIPNNSLFNSNSLIVYNILYFDSLKLFSQEEDLFGNKIQSIVNNSQYTAYKNGQKIIEYSKKDADALLREMSCEPSCYLWLNYHKFLYEGDEVIGNVDCYVVRAYHKFHPYLKESLFYFNKENYLLVKNTSVGFNRHFLYEDYRKVSGILLPFKEQKFEFEKLLEEKTITELSINYFVNDLNIFFEKQ